MLKIWRENEISLSSVRVVLLVCQSVEVLFMNEFMSALVFIVLAGPVFFLVM